MRLPNPFSLEKLLKYDTVWNFIIVWNITVETQRFDSQPVVLWLEIDGLNNAVTVV